VHLLALFADAWRDEHAPRLRLRLDGRGSE